jgi:hypothetical protein
MSDRLTTSRREIPRYHIALEDANTVLAQACLGILLRDPSCDPVDQSITDLLSLAHYAGRNWVTHAQIANVAPRIHDGMQRLFDPDKPYFSACVTDQPGRLCNFDCGCFPDDLQDKRQPQATSLYCAALCGFNEIVKIIATKNPQHASALAGSCGTALHAALLQGHVQVIRFLLQ